MDGKKQKLGELVSAFALATHIQVSEIRGRGDRSNRGASGGDKTKGLFYHREARTDRIKRGYFPTPGAADGKGSDETTDRRPIKAVFRTGPDPVTNGLGVTVPRSLTPPSKEK